MSLAQVEGRIDQSLQNGPRRVDHFLHQGNQRAVYGYVLGGARPHGDEHGRH